MRRSILLLVLLMALVIVQCKKSSSPAGAQGTGLAPYDSLRFISVSATSLEADSAGTSVITVQVEVNDSAGPSDEFVIFHTNLGYFPNGLRTDTVAANSGRRASVALLSDTVGTAMVSATVDNFTKDTSIVFTPALPDDMLCSADPYTGPDSAGFNISCVLYRDPGRGKVTDPIKVLFSCTPATGANSAPALIFPAFAYSVNGMVTDSIENPYRNTGSFILQATVGTDKGATVNRPATIVIN